MLSKIWVWVPGSEIRDPVKTYSGSRIQVSKRHRITDPGFGSATLVSSSFFSCFLFTSSTGTNYYKWSQFYGML
jgi:hypothetical protein